MAFLAIDLSNNNPEPVDLGAARKGGIQLLVHKASEGTAFVDPLYAPRMARAHQTGLFRMSYHFARPENDPAAEGRFAATAAHGHYGPYSTGVLDVEVGDGDLSPWALKWLAAFYGSTGRKPWLYASDSFVRAHLTDPALADYPLWLASWVPWDPRASVADLVEQAPLCPPPWTRYSMWQHADDASVPGVPGPVDRSLFMGTADEWRTLH